MILGIGIDLVSAARIEHLMLQFGEKFPQKIFTKEEINCAEKIKILPENFLPRALFYAKRFAAKEAFSKALGLGIGRGVDFLDIQIENNNLGAPGIKILNGKEEFIKKHFDCKNFVTHLSLSDENPLASAYVIIEKIS
jgi:holo-[acyl-carrier protein] synthase